MCCLYTLLAHCSLCWLPHWFERGKLRKKYNLKEDNVGDLCTTIFCGPCALCQEAREIKLRGNFQCIDTTERVFLFLIRSTK